MTIQAIVYTSATGFTARYAALLAEATGLPAFSLAEALVKLHKGTPVLYMGWLMAGSVKDYRKAAAHFAIPALVGVGLGDAGAQDEAVRKAHRLPADMPVFTLQGGMEHARLEKPYRIAISILTKVMAAKKNRSPGEERMLALLQSGGDFVSADQLAPVLAWLRA